VIVYSLEGSGTVSTTENTLSPAATMALGAIALGAALVLGTGGRTERRMRRRPKRDKGPPRWQRALQKGSARTTFVVGALLTLPGAAYLAGLSRIDKLNYSTPATVLLIVAFNLVMMILLEVPLVCFTVAPDWTVKSVERGKAWIRRHGRRFAVTGLGVIGVLLIVKGLIELLS
jgi:hypothetical protein